MDDANYLKTRELVVKYAALISQDIQSLE
jgi:hypothetical protein